MGTVSGRSRVSRLEAVDIESTSGNRRKGARIGAMEKLMLGFGRT